MSTTTQTSPPRPATWTLKVAMAITGSILAAFVLVHLFGNLKVYTGAEHFDDYAQWLRTAFKPFLPEGFVLLAFRIVIGGSFLIHIVAATVLWTRARKARGPHRASIRAARTGFQSFSARLMPLTGVLLLAFVIIHLLDLTIGIQPIASEAFHHAEGTRPDAYANLIASFSRSWMAAIYVAAMALVSLHVAHGITTVAQDLGAMGYRLRMIAAIVAGIVALAILLGNASIPLAVQFGVLT